MQKIAISFTPFDNRSDNGQPSIGPTTQKSVIPTNNVHTIQDVLNVLEPLAQKLSEREFSHELSKADMILDSMQVAMMVLQFLYLINYLHSH